MESEEGQEREAEQRSVAVVGRHGCVVARELLSMGRALAA
jgi:hypothetical protein